MSWENSPPVHGAKILKLRANVMWLPN